MEMFPREFLTSHRRASRVFLGQGSTLLAFGPCSPTGNKQKVYRHVERMAGTEDEEINGLDFTDQNVKKAMNNGSRSSMLVINIHPDGVAQLIMDSY
eukprot:scaffold732_cov48-Attheya_sp.AAC.10